jgi:chemotaxis protein MotB
MGRKKSEEEQAPGAPMWMATFGDLMSLLLTFFVLLLSFSTIQEADFNNAMGSLQGALGMLTSPHEKINFIIRKFAKPVSYRYRFIRQGEISSFKRPEVDFEHQKQDYQDSLPDVMEEVTTEARLYGIADLVSVDYYEKGIKIRIPGSVLFEEGTDKLKENEVAYKILDKVIEVVSNLAYGISIEGHTDNKRIETREFDSNWELASARAISVLKYFQDKGIDPRRLSAVSCGEYKPFMDNNTLRGRKLNRRVEINLDVSKKN